MELQSGAVVCAGVTAPHSSALRVLHRYEEPDDTRVVQPERVGLTLEAVQRLIVALAAVRVHELKFGERSTDV